MLALKAENGIENMRKFLSPSHGERDLRKLVRIAPGFSKEKQCEANIAQMLAKLDGDGILAWIMKKESANIAKKVSG